MKFKPRTFTKFLAAIMLVALTASLGVYLLLSASWAHDRLTHFAQTSLSNLLGTKVEVESVAIQPFNRLDIRGVKIYDDFDSVALDVSHINARFEMAALIFEQKIIIDYVSIDGLRAGLYKHSPDAPLNIANIISHLSKPDDNKPKPQFLLRIEYVGLKNGSFSYDVLSLPDTPNRFNPNHIAVSDLSFSVALPRISPDSVIADITNFTATEHCGLQIRDIDASILYTPSSISLSDVAIAMPASVLDIPRLTASATKDSLDRFVWSNPSVVLDVANDSHIALRDIAPAFPALKNIDKTVYLGLSADGSLSQLDVKTLNISESSSSTRLSARAHIDNVRNIKEMTVDSLELSLSSHIPTIISTLQRADVALPAKLSSILSSLGTTELAVTGSGSLSMANIDLNVKSAVGSLVGSVDAGFVDKNISTNAVLRYNNINVSALAGIQKRLNISGNANIDFDIKNSVINAVANADVQSLVFDNVNYSDINIAAMMAGDDIALDIASDNPGCALALNAQGILSQSQHMLDVTYHIDGKNIALSDFGVRSSINNVATDISGSVSAHNIDDFTASLLMRNTMLTDTIGQQFNLKQLDIDIDNRNLPNYITIRSDVLNGKLEGTFSTPTLLPAIKDIASHVFPALVEARHIELPDDIDKQNHFTFDFTVSDADELCQFLRLPVRVIYPITLNGTIDDLNHTADVYINAPYILQGSKLIEDTAAYVMLDGKDDTATGFATTHFDTKKGPMTLLVNLDGKKNEVISDIHWKIERSIPINGLLSFDTRFEKSPLGSLETIVGVNPGHINFGDETWSIHKSAISYIDKTLTVADFKMTTPTQSIGIDGSATQSPLDSLTVKLNNVNLDAIFETLEIDKARLCGFATGELYASNVFTSEPHLYTPCLHVDSIGYNRCVMGTADIRANWDNERKGIHLDADVVEPGGAPSRIWGDIFPATEELDINFQASKVRVGFMKPFMNAFASDITGLVSGYARLFGSFKYIDMEGDLFVDNLGITIAFTNTTYFATDSLHIRPGVIEIPPITIKDKYGHTARLKGMVGHTFFKDPTFDFTITDAREFLSYDVPPKPDEIWYGRIFGNGSAYVNGKPGVVNIGVNMSTAPHSTFTFILSDAQVADEYSFITFRDKTVIEGSEQLQTQVDEDDIPLIIRQLQQHAQQQSAGKPTEYNMDFQVDITPEARIVLVMDPKGGDEIKANGVGNLRMTYGSTNNDLRMYGTYTLDRGSYNFTLQDIIIKDFTIKEGSTITFYGDPYAAQLDIKAIYAVNANLSDLDESFTQDKELNRTNVPVHALLMVKGDMRQPDISFDLEFPTLSIDTYRKVRSIVSTEDMMNRQIIYLLALNRFYTPDYMSATTKGNELFSVASSTISSQLSSMLGKLSENWSIAPYLRSDKGDFSDIEVDLMLSSNLLNNRLLLNGNFGYRDKSLNSNQFVGDFDIEYLLNRRGSLRLKAYNRYNDQNYYLRTAQTTQGLGIMFKRDFDNMFRFLHPNKKSNPSDTITPPSK